MGENSIYDDIQIYRKERIAELEKQLAEATTANDRLDEMRGRWMVKAKQAEKREAVLREALREIISMGGVSAGYARAALEVK